MKTIFMAASVAAVASAAMAAPGGHFIENWDADGDGMVSLAEIQERRGDVFYTFDENEDGLLSGSEYVAFDEAREADMQGQGDHGKGGMKRAAMGMTLAFNDADGDGAVSRDEFMAKSADWMALLDRNEDGSVTAADFGNH